MFVGITRGVHKEQWEKEGLNLEGDGWCLDIILVDCPTQSVIESIHTYTNIVFFASIHLIR